MGSVLTVSWVSFNPSGPLYSHCSLVRVVPSRGREKVTPVKGESVHSHRDHIVDFLELFTSLFVRVDMDTSSDSGSLNSTLKFLPQQPQVSRVSGS